MSECGLQPCTTSIPTALTVADVDDRRVVSIGAAADWAKMNNLLGVFLRSDLLVRLVLSLLGSYRADTANERRKFHH